MKDSLMMMVGAAAGLIDAEEYLQFHQNIPSGRVPEAAQLSGVLPPAEPAGRSLCRAGRGSV